jgi:hypothetical protein
VKAASLSGRSGRKIEGQERGDVGRAAIFEDVAVLFVVANRACPDIILRRMCGSDYVGGGVRRT